MVEANIFDVPLKEVSRLKFIQYGGIPLIASLITIRRVINDVRAAWTAKFANILYW